MKLSASVFFFWGGSLTFDPIQEKSPLNLFFLGDDSEVVSISVADV